ELSDEDLLSGKSSREPAMDRLHVARGDLRRKRHILPVGQDMDGYEIDGRGHLGVTQPKFPNIRVSDWHSHLFLYFADGPNELPCRHFPAQQDLVPDDHRLDRLRITLRKNYR